MNTTDQTLRHFYGLSCPNCGQAGWLQVQITCTADLTAEGTEPHHSHEWDETSLCRCPHCDHADRVSGFKTKGQDRKPPTHGHANSEHDYLFDAKLFTSLRVRAPSERQARRILAELLDSATINCGALPDGSALTGEASPDGELDLVEIDGEPAC